MKQEAIEKINLELQKWPNDGYLEIIAHYIIDRCAADEGAAEAVFKADKSLTGCMGCIEAEARRTAQNNIGVVTSLALYDLIDGYFGFSRDEYAQQKHAEAVCMSSSQGHKSTSSAKPAPHAGTLLDFDDFL